MTRLGWAVVSLLLVVSLLNPYCCWSARSIPRLPSGIRNSLSQAGRIGIPMPTPGRNGVSHNDYRCSSVPSPLPDSYIVQYEPRADPRVAHHMLLFGCRDPVKRGSWSCKSTASICRFSDVPQVVFAWALNASGLHMPPNVGFRVGPSVNINYLVIQIHYGHPESVPDLSTVSKQALIVHTSVQKQKYIAGIYLMGSGRSIRAGQKQYFVDSACEFSGPKPIYPFAFRTHAHSLGQQIVGYVVKPGNRWEMIGTRSPQDPQAFYPVSQKVSVEPSNWLAARCVFNTEHKHHTVHMGPDSEDEMCNYYIMYYTLNDNRKLLQNNCWAPAPPTLHFPSKLPELPSVSTPMDREEEDHHHSHESQHHSHENQLNKEQDCPGSDKCRIPTPSTTPPTTATSASITHLVSHEKITPTPTKAPPTHETAPLTHEMIPPTHGTAPPTTSQPHHPGSSKMISMLMPSEDWALNGVSIPEVTLGQVTAVAVDAEGNIHILHRGPITWDFSSFNSDFTYRHIHHGLIKIPTMLKFSSTGSPERAWGQSLFYMPHGLTIDHTGSFWVTDVAMHQVFKFSSLGDKRPTLTLGRAFYPGSQLSRFCQPTSVAVDKSGTIYVADGYCNQRIMVFNSGGIPIKIWRSAVGGQQMFVPHKAILNAAETLLYVADRENQRILTFDTSNGHGQVFSQREDLKYSPYAISFNSSHSDWPLLGVFGGRSGNTGFILDQNGKTVNTWGPKEGFEKPHDLVVDTVHNAVYVTEIGPNRIWKFVTVPGFHPDISEDLEDVLNSHYKTHPSLNSTTISPTLSSTPTPNEHPLNSSPSSTTTGTPPKDSSNETEVSNITSIKSSKPLDHRTAVKKPKVGVNVGVIIAVFAVALLTIIVTIGVLREHKYLKFKGWRMLQSGKRDTTIGVKSSGTTVRRETEKTKKKKKKKRLSPQKKLQSLLGPSQLGFSRLKTYDSDSEEEEFPVFNRV